jgi:outer membrane protein OmpA-like peptidoglycan-associated protein
MASTASERARLAGSTAQGAAGHVDQLNGTVNGLDQFHQTAETEIVFRAGQSGLSPVARRRLDDLAASLNGQHGYLLELEAHSPLAGSAGIQSSARLGEEVKRYLVTRHEIPVYRLHMVALGNARGSEEKGSRNQHASSVHVRLVENSLASQQGTAEIGSSSSVERP